MSWNEFIRGKKLKSPVCLKNGEEVVVGRIDRFCSVAGTVDVILEPDENPNLGLIKGGFLEDVLYELTHNCFGSNDCPLRRWPLGIRRSPCILLPTVLEKLGR